MERKMSKKLLDWKNNKEKTPLILYGARQVGKTYTILSFGKENYKNVAYINFEDNTEISKIFEQDLEVERIIKELSVRLGITIENSMPCSLNLFNCSIYDWEILLKNSYKKMSIIFD